MCNRYWILLAHPIGNVAVSTIEARRGFCLLPVLQQETQADDELKTPEAPSPFCYVAEKKSSPTLQCAIDLNARYRMLEILDERKC
jgi:hypothetical protein